MNIAELIGMWIGRDFRGNPDTTNAANPSTTSAGAPQNHAVTKNIGHAGTIGPSTGAALMGQQSQKGQKGQMQIRQPDFFSAPSTPNQIPSHQPGLSTAVAQDETTEQAANQPQDDIKPRSLRFTWSMKTTSSLAPDEMMK